MSLDYYERILDTSRGSSTIRGEPLAYYISVIFFFYSSAYTHSVNIFEELPSVKLGIERKTQHM